MLRIATLAAAAALLAAAPASAASIHVSTAGKSPEAVKAEVVAAASKLCQAEGGASFDLRLQAACMKGTVDQALAPTSASAPLKLSAR
jgi:hypothetical protein